MRLLTLTSALTAAVLSTAAFAQAPKPAAAPTATAAAPAAAPAVPQNPVIVTVNGEAVRATDVIGLINRNVPAEQRQSLTPEQQQQLTGRALSQLISDRALAIMAKKQGLDRDPTVAREMQSAADQVLVNDLMVKTVFPMVTEETIKAQYDKQYAGKPGEPQVHARHILVDSEAKAKDIIKQLQGGAKFEDLAKKYGDPKDAATQQGGDLGTFKKADMLPEFSDAAFKLKKNEYTTTPVHTRYGWHVIQVLDTSVSTPPAYDTVHDELRQTLVRQNAQALATRARDAVKIVSYGPDGKPAKPVAPVKK